MDILYFATWLLHAFAQFLDRIIDFIKICNGFIMTIFYKSLYIFQSISFKSPGSVVLHHRLKFSEQLLVIDNITKFLRVTVQTVYTANRLK